jgi:hypothetical protein
MKWLGHTTGTSPGLSPQACPGWSWCTKPPRLSKHVPAQGALLSSVVALAAPFASEIVLMRLGLWHYPRPDVFIAGAGVVSWVMWCARAGSVPV